MLGFGAEPRRASAKPFSNPVKPYSKRKVCVDGKVMITASSARHLHTAGKVTPAQAEARPQDRAGPRETGLALQVWP